ncbi:hypothetical protein V8B97DRAFT_551148 [Scleroderma yunnanense]
MDHILEEGTSVNKEVLRARAGLLMEIGQIFEEAMAEPPDESQHDLLRVLADAKADTSKHALLLAARAAQRAEERYTTSSKASLQPNAQGDGMLRTASRTPPMEKLASSPVQVPSCIDDDERAKFTLLSSNTLQLSTEKFDAHEVGSTTYCPAPSIALPSTSIPKPPLPLHVERVPTITSSASNIPKVSTEVNVQSVVSAGPSPIPAGHQPWYVYEVLLLSVPVSDVSRTDLA